MKFQLLNAVNESLKVPLQFVVDLSRTDQMPCRAPNRELISTNTHGHYPEHSQQQFPIEPPHVGKTAYDHAAINAEQRNCRNHIRDGGNVVGQHRQNTMSPKLFKRV